MKLGKLGLSVVGLIFLAGFFSGRAHAAQKPPSQIEEDVRVETPPPATPSKLGLSYFGVYQGPAPSNLYSNGTINTTTLNYDDSSPQNLWNQFKLDYNITDKWFAGPVVNFQIFPSGMANPFMMLDSGVRVGNRQVFHTDDVNLAIDFRVMYPFKPSYRKNDERIDLQSVQNLTYKIPKTKITVGVLGFHYYQLYGSSVPIKDPRNPRDPRDLNMYFAPNASYQLSKTVAATFFVEFYPYHLLNDGWLSIKSDPMDLAPGISWDITPAISVNPQIVLYPSRLSLNTINTLVYFIAKIF